MAGGSDEEPSAHALREIVVPQDQDFAEKRWLWRVMNYKVDAGEVQDKERVKIPKVSWEVTNRKWYEPEAVSIGPYHYKEPKLRQVQELKVRFASTFVTKMNGSPSVQEVYGKVGEVAGEARKYYSQGALGGMTDEEFTDVMFLDSCFVLEFISRAPGIDFTGHLQMDVNLIRLVSRDLLLLDNQVPFIVFEALCGYPKLTEAFVDFLASCSLAGIRFQNGTKPIHLLDLLSFCLYNPRDRPPRIIPNAELMTFPSVTRLEEMGIYCWPTKSLCATAICFTPKLFTAELKIPPVHITEHCMNKWMNLAAYQIYAADAPPPPDVDARGIGAAEYIWMLDKLIDDAEDVRKLRTKHIISHSLESDQQAVNVFKNMSKNITNDWLGMTTKFPKACDKESQNHLMRSKYRRWVYNKLPMTFGKERVLVTEINYHLRSKFRRWGYDTLYRPYFRSAWSLPAFMAAVSGLVLTFLQVYYEIYPRRQPI